MTSPRKHILILCFTDTRHDIRVARQIDFLQQEYEVTFAGYDMHQADKAHFHPLPQVPLTPVRKAKLGALLLGRQYEQAYWTQYPYQSLRQKLNMQQYSLILANDIESLPLAFHLAEGTTAKILFDAHEYAPRHFEDRLYWKIFFQGFNKYFCRKYIPQVGDMMTVCDGLATEYQKDFGVLPKVMTNAPAYREGLQPSEVNPKRIRLIHHGILTISRKIGNMIEMMQYVDERFTLDLMLKIPPTASQKTKNHLEELKAMAAQARNTRFVPPLLSHEVIDYIQQYDIGLFLLEPINFNYTHALPNKLFDFIQARLGVAIGPSLEMEKVVRKHQLGVVSDDFTPQSLARSLNALTLEDIVNFKQNSHHAARELSALRNQELLLRTVKEMTG